LHEIYAKSSAELPPTNDGEFAPGEIGAAAQKFEQVVKSGEALKGNVQAG
jgi:hypothetical protein